MDFSAYTISYFIKYTIEPPVFLMVLTPFLQSESEEKKPFETYKEYVQCYIYLT